MSQNRARQGSGSDLVRGTTGGYTRSARSGSLGSVLSNSEYTIRSGSTEDFLSTDGRGMRSTRPGHAAQSARCADGDTPERPPPRIPQRQRRPSQTSGSSDETRTFTSSSSRPNMGRTESASELVRGTSSGYTRSPSQSQDPYSPSLSGSEFTVRSGSTGDFLSTDGRERRDRHFGQAGRSARRGAGDRPHQNPPRKSERPEQRRPSHTSESSDETRTLTSSSSRQNLGRTESASELVRGTSSGYTRSQSQSQDPYSPSLSGSAFTVRSGSTGDFLSTDGRGTRSRRPLQSARRTQGDSSLQPTPEIPQRPAYYRPSTPGGLAEERRPLTSSSSSQSLIPSWQPFEPQPLPPPPPSPPPPEPYHMSAASLSQNQQQQQHSQSMSNRRSPSGASSSVHEYLALQPADTESHNNQRRDQQCEPLGRSRRQRRERAHHWLLHRHCLISTIVASSTLSVLSLAMLLLTVFRPVSFSWESRIFKEGSYETCVKCAAIINSVDHRDWPKLISKTVAGDNEVYCCARSNDQMSALYSMVMSEPEKVPVSADDCLHKNSPAAHKHLLPCDPKDPCELEGRITLKINPNVTKPSEISRKVHVQSNGLHVQHPGLYFVYSGIFYHNKQLCNELKYKEGFHYINRHSQQYPVNSGILVKSVHTCCRDCKSDYTSKFAGGVFQLNEGDLIFITVNQLNMTSFDGTSSFVGIMMLGDLGKDSSSEAKSGKR